MDFTREEAHVSQVTVSPEFQVVIPQDVREALSLRPGEKLEVFRYENRIELIPIRPVREMRGFLRGMDTTLDRDPDRV
jgi:AbrB family looped-hinge helix DNA binding protein